MISRLIAITLNTFREAVRDRVLYNLILFVLLLVASAPLFGQISIGMERLILVNVGLSSISLFGVIIAIFLGIGLVSKEIEKKTLYTILSRPVRRWEFIVGKYLGLIMTLVVNTALMTAGNSLEAPLGSLYARAAGSIHPRTGMPTNALILPEAIDPGRVEVDADKATGGQDALAFEKVEGQHARGAHQFAPVAPQPGSVPVVPEQKGGLAQDPEVAFAAGHFGVVVEGVGLAVGSLGHECQAYRGNVRSNAL